MTCLTSYPDDKYRLAIIAHAANSAFFELNDSRSAVASISLASLDLAYTCT